MTSSSSRELLGIQKKIWAGSIPVAFHLDPVECSTYDQSDPYLANVPRIGYLPFLLPKLFAFFRPKLIDPVTEPHHGWFSIDGSPLQWHYPAGLLFDIHSSIACPNIRRHMSELNSEDTENADESPEPQPQSEDTTTPSSLPWRVTIRFHSYPKQALIPLDPEFKVLRDMFSNSYKQSTYIRYRHRKVAMDLSIETKDRLWSSTKSQDVDHFNTANRSLLDPDRFFGSIQGVALRLFIPTPTPPTQTQAPPDQPDTPTRHFSFVAKQVPVSPETGTTVQDEQSRWPGRTLGSALCQVAPTLFPSATEPDRFEPVIHGAVISMSAPLESLTRYVAFPDGWVCVTLSARS